MKDLVDAALTDLEKRSRLLRRLKNALASVSRLPSASAPLSIATASRSVAALGKLAVPEAVALLPALSSAATAAANWLEDLKADRSNVTRRREALARLVGKDGWPIEQTGTTDYVGPFELRHAPDSTKIRFGSFVLKTLRHPAPEELRAAVRAMHAALEADAQRGFPEFLQAIERVHQQRPLEEFLPWPQLVEAVIPEAKQRKRLAKVLVFRLAMLLSGRGPAGWRLAILPPTLQEQRRATVVPRLNQANAPVRVFRMRLSR